MLDVLHKYDPIKGTKSLGIELSYSSKNDFTLRAVELTKTKGAIAVSNTFEQLSWEEIATSGLKKLPIYLGVDGKGVMHRKITVSEHTKDQELLHQILPNASLNDFYLQKSALTKQEYWVSIIRKDTLEKLLAELEELNLFVIHIYLGPFTIENCASLINTSEIYTETQHLLIEQNKISAIQISKPINDPLYYQIDTEKVSYQSVTSFANAFTHFLPINHITHLSSEKLRTSKEEYFNKNKYVAIGFSLLVFFFLVTVTNLFLGSAYQNTNNKLQYEANSKKEYITELARLKKTLEIKEQFIQSSGIIQATRISYYSDQIASSIPKNIRLNQMAINPLSKRINKAEDIRFNYKKIKISGVVDKSIALNTWIKKLKAYSWVNDIDIISFLQENLNTSGEFEIEVSIK